MSSLLRLIPTVVKNLVSRRFIKPGLTRNTAGWLAFSSLVTNLQGCGEPAPSAYYRVTAHLMHGTEPVTIDRVVECRYAGGSGEMRGYVRTTVKPVVFGVPTNDGGMAFMVAPDYCGRKGTNTEYVPFLMWSDGAGDFSFFTGFLDKTALEEPTAPLRFLDTILRPADSAEYVAWQRATPPTIVPPRPNPFLGDMRGPAIGCAGMLHLSIPQDIRANVVAQWPASHPHYWVPTFALSKSVQRALNFHDLNQHNAYSEGWSIPDRLIERDNLYVVGDHEYFDDKGRSVPGGTVLHETVSLHPPGLGIIHCGVIQPRATLLVYDKYVLDDGQSPPVRITNDNFFIKDDTDLFIDWGFGFDIERGDPDHD